MDEQKAVSCETAFSWSYHHPAAYYGAVMRTATPLP